MKLNKLLKPLRNTKGDGVNISSLFSAALSVFIIVLFIYVGGILHQYDQLNMFAKEMTYTAAREGMCGGKIIDERFIALKDATGLEPNIVFEADFLPGSNKRVQYGDVITVKLDFETKLLSLGSLSLPFTINAKAVEESKEYWKNV